jgi:hypothetical protein
VMIVAAAKETVSSSILSVRLQTPQLLVKLGGALDIGYVQSHVPQSGISMLQLESPANCRQLFP